MMYKNHSHMWNDLKHASQLWNSSFDGFHGQMRYQVVNHQDLDTRTWTSLLVFTTLVLLRLRYVKSFDDGFLWW
jgi:hypothetical protein